MSVSDIWSSINSFLSDFVLNFNTIIHSVPMFLQPIVTCYIVVSVVFLLNPFGQRG